MFILKTFSKHKKESDIERMQEKLNECNDAILSPFVFEDDYEMWEVSIEHKERRKAKSILIDSGASDSVAPPGMFPQIQILETNASRAGMEYTAAGGHKIPNFGMQRPYIHLLDGSKYTMAFQVAGVSKALGAVSRIVGAGNRVCSRWSEHSRFIHWKQIYREKDSIKATQWCLLYGLSLIHIWRCRRRG